jgi:hypothetical protein
MRLPEDHPWLRAIIAADISNASKEQYIRHLVKLQTLAGGRSFETVISHPKTMIKRIDAEYPSLQSRKAMVSAIKAVVKYNPQIEEEYKSHIEKWNAQFRILDKTITERVATAEPTQKELQNWVEWKDVLKKQAELGSLGYGTPAHLLLSMYSLIEPIRADYGNIKIIEEGEEEAPSDINHILLSKQPEGSKLVLHQYKTSRKYGTFQRPLPEQLVQIIRASLTRQPRQYLFVDESGKPYLKKNSYTRFTNRTFERLFGKRFTISLMRHSFISNLDFNEATPATLFQHSKNMMHSIGTQQMYRRKIVPALTVQKVESSPASTSSSSSRKIYYV